MIRVHFDQYESQTTLLDWVSKQLGAPSDLPVKAKFLQSKQIWYPFWISRVDADSTYRGLGKDATFHDAAANGNLSAEVLTSISTSSGSQSLGSSPDGMRSTSVP